MTIRHRSSQVRVGSTLGYYGAGGLALPPRPERTDVSSSATTRPCAHDETVLLDGHCLHQVWSLIHLAVLLSMLSPCGESSKASSTTTPNTTTTSTTITTTTAEALCLTVIAEPVTFLRCADTVGPASTPEEWRCSDGQSQPPDFCSAHLST